MIETLLALLLAVTPGIGKVVDARGKANLNGQVARNGLVVRAGDRLMTGPGSSVLIALANGGALRVYANSSVALNQPQRVHLLTGRLLNAFRGQGGFRVETPRLAAAVTGTAFYVEESAGREGYICTCTGSVRVESATHPQSQALLTAPPGGRHRALSVVGDKRQAAPMLGHTDPEVDELLAIAEQQADAE